MKNNPTKLTASSDASCRGQNCSCNCHPVCTCNTACACGEAGCRCSQNQGKR